MSNKAPFETMMAAYSFAKQVIDVPADQDKKIKEFSDLLDTLENTQDKKKMLWLDIYENALTDRTNAYILFMDIYITLEARCAPHMRPTIPGAWPMPMALRSAEPTGDHRERATSTYANSKMGGSVWTTPKGAGRHANIL